MLWSAIKVFFCTVVAWALFALAASFLLWLCVGDVSAYGHRPPSFGAVVEGVAALILVLSVARFAIVAPLLTVDRSSGRFGSSWNWSIIVWPPRAS